MIHIVIESTDRKSYKTSVSEDEAMAVFQWVDSPAPDGRLWQFSDDGFQKVCIVHDQIVRITFEVAAS